MRAREGTDVRRTPKRRPAAYLPADRGRLPAGGGGRRPETGGVAAVDETTRGGAEAEPEYRAARLPHAGARTRHRDPARAGSVRRRRTARFAARVRGRRAPDRRARPSRSLPSRPARKRPDARAERSGAGKLTIPRPVAELTSRQFTCG